MFRSTNRACRCDHGKRSIFWFHENVQFRKCPYFVRQKHISAWPKSRWIYISFCGGCPAHSFAESAWEPHRTMISIFFRFCCVHKCASRTRLAHISDSCSFSHKTHKRKNMLQSRVRRTFGICACHGGLQSGHAARHFSQNCDCHSRNLLQLPRAQPRNSNKCIWSSLILRCCMIILKFRTSQMTTS